MKNVAIYGGAFDPIHNGHIAIIQELIKNKEMDEVWIMPTRVSRWKNDAAPSSLRLKCINKVIENFNNVHLKTNEIESNKKIIYTIDTIEELYNEYEDINFYFVIGYDQLAKLNKWKEIDKLSNLVKFLVVGRPLIEFHENNCIKYHCRLLNFEGPDISSSKFRETLDLSLLPKCIHNILWAEPYYYQEKLKKILTEKRYLHSISTMNLAKNIAKANGFDISHASIAALLHDCAKEIPEELENEIMNNHFKKINNIPKAIKHQFTGYILVEDLFNIKDKMIKQAILYHTTANKEMTWLDKIVYVCDKIEPLRGYDSNWMINECLKDLNRGFIIVLKENLSFLEKKHVPNDFEWTQEAIKYYL